MRGVFRSLILMLLLWGSHPAGAATTVFPHAEYKPEVDSAAIEKGITNLIGAMESAEKVSGSKPASAGQILVAAIFLLGGIFAFRRFSPHIAKLLEGRNTTSEVAVAQ